MSLIKSISGIRGTIGGERGHNLTPVDIVEFSAAFATFLLRTQAAKKVCIGRDARISGSMVQNLVMNTLIGCGIDVVDLGLSTTPTVEMAVPHTQSGGGIVITASHNPEEWNALKFLNASGEFISAEDGSQILDIIEQADFHFSPVHELGTITSGNDYLDYHIDRIMELPYVNISLIREKGFRIVIDPVNSTGGFTLARLLDRLHCSYELINDDLSGKFAHNPEPLPEHLSELMAKVIESGADMGISVDPDVDRLALVSEDGSVFGEEYTLVAAADLVLSKKDGNTVSNLSSTRALHDITTRHGGQYTASAVGEVNVVTKMKETNAIIGGEGNGGVILPDLHYGRDALVGVALILTLMAESGKTLSELRNSYPEYIMKKDKIQLTADLDVDGLLKAIADHFQSESVNQIDGVKIDFEQGWVHLRKSNTEPILRLYAEAGNEKDLQLLTDKVKEIIKNNI